MAQLRDTLIQGSARVTDTLYANIVNTSILNTDSLNTNENITLTSASGDSPAIIFDRGSTNTDWKLLVTAGKLSFQSRTGTNDFTERGYFADNSGAFWALTHNGLTLTAATTGFTIAGGTTSKTLTVSDTVSLSGGSNQHFAVYGANNAISGSLNARLIDESGPTVANKRNELALGNNIESTTNGSAYGRLALYSQNTAGTYLISASGRSWQTATLQAKTGIIAYTDDITTAIQGLDSTLPAGSATSKTLTALTITDGKMTAATFSDISIGASQVSSGTLDAARIPTLSITDKTSGTLTVARGGTGVTSFTNDCVIVATGTTQTLVSRGLKVTGAAGANITLSPDTAGKTMTISSTTGAMTLSSTTAALTVSSTTGNMTLGTTGSGKTTLKSGTGDLAITSGATLYMNRATGASIVFQQNNTETARFNQKSNLQLGLSHSTQDTYKLAVGGNAGITGQLSFISGSGAGNLTENASMQYDSTLHAIKFIVT